MKTDKHNGIIKKTAGLLGWLGICYVIAWFGARVSPGLSSSVWYETLQKPAWNPPARIFGPVWTTLYTMMGVAVWVIWKKYGFNNAGKALLAFLIQLVLNGLWSYIFFYFEAIGWAFVEIVVLLAAIGITTALFFQKSSLAGWLMVPYLLWVGFATVLTGTLWWMN